MGKKAKVGGKGTKLEWMGQHLIEEVEDEGVKKETTLEGEGSNIRPVGVKIGVKRKSGKIEKLGVGVLNCYFVHFPLFVPI